MLSRVSCFRCGVCYRQAALLFKLEFSFCRYLTYAALFFPFHPLQNYLKHFHRGRTTGRWRWLNLSPRRSRGPGWRLACSVAPVSPGCTIPPTSTFSCWEPRPRQAVRQPTLRRWWPLCRLSFSRGRMRRGPGPAGHLWPPNLETTAGTEPRYIPTGNSDSSYVFLSMWPLELTGVQCFWSVSVSCGSRFSPKFQCWSGSRVPVECGSGSGSGSRALRCFGGIRCEYVDTFISFCSSGGHYMLFLREKTWKYVIWCKN